MNSIHYICHYKDEKSNRDLDVLPSGISKINYIKYSLKQNNFNVSIFSVAQATKKEFMLYPIETFKIDDKESVTYISSFGRTNIIFKIVSRLWMQLQLILFIALKLNKDDIILVYHSLVLVWPINLINFFLDRKIYFEVEEIFSAVKLKNDKKIAYEINYLKNARGYIFVNDYFPTISQFKDKPFSVCYGDYKVNKVYNRSYKDRVSNNKLNLLYAGSIGGLGSDVYLAIESVRLLKNYKLSILGFGNQSDIKALELYIKKTNEENVSNEIKYYGCLTGQEYLDFISKCDIGLCPRILDNSYSKYTFPSKILVYLSNGLVPVSTPLYPVIKSEIKDSISISQDYSPESFSKAILNSTRFANISNNLFVLNSLNKSFVSSLNSLFS